MQVEAKVISQEEGGIIIIMLLITIITGVSKYWILPVSVKDFTYPFSFFINVFLKFTFLVIIIFNFL